MVKKFTYEEDWELKEMQKDLRNGEITKEQYEVFLILTGRYKIYEGKI
ncbi:MAG: hypothetical protein ACE5J7_01590 [Candidatus Aenigmatarchaeota archaeon]